VGNGDGAVDKGSGENATSDATGLECQHWLELDTITFQPGE